MRVQPSYVPKVKRKLNVKVVIPLVVFLALVVYVLVTTFFLNSEPRETGYAVCGLSDYESRKRVSNRLETLNQLDVLPLGDYGVYGESLSIYEETFVFGTVDPMIGRTITLTNVCDTDQQFTFLFGSNLDMRIQLDHLPPGFYDIDVLSDLRHFTLVSETEVQEVFSTVVRGGMVKTATLHANQALFDLGEETVLTKPYVFLEVKEEAPTEDEYDIVLDPAGGSIQYNGTSDPGHTYRDLIERDEMFVAAVEIKEILEQHGLRVLIARDNITPVNVFGEGGRIHDAYRYKAKYYIQLRLETSGSAMDRGIMALFSNFASNRFPTSIVSQILENTNLQATPYDDGANINGVYRTNLTDGFDTNDVVRETGGIFTGAGRMDEDFQELQGFAQEFRNGMVGVSIIFGYLTDDDDYRVWTTEKQDIIRETAQGILLQLNINGE